MKHAALHEAVMLVLQVQTARAQAPPGLTTGQSCDVTRMHQLADQHVALDSAACGAEPSCRGPLLLHLDSAAHSDLALFDMGLLALVS